MSVGVRVSVGVGISVAVRVSVGVGVAVSVGERVGVTVGESVGASVGESITVGTLDDPVLLCVSAPALSEFPREHPARGTRPPRAARTFRLDNPDTFMSFNFQVIGLVSLPTAIPAFHLGRRPNKESCLRAFHSRTRSG